MIPTIAFAYEFNLVLEAAIILLVCYGLVMLCVKIYGSIANLIRTVIRFFIFIFERKKAIKKMKALGFLKKKLKIPKRDLSKELQEETLPQIGIKDDGITQDKVEKATKAEMKAQSNSVGIVTPDVLVNHPLVPKAYGRLAFSSSSSAFTGVNISTVTRPQGNKRMVTLSVTMADTNYVVINSLEDSSGHQVAGMILSTSNKTATSFILNGDEAGEGANKYIYFTVFGQIA